MHSSRSGRRPWHSLTAEEREGIRRAQQHIREAEAFHRETRGVVELIQRYLYQLSGTRYTDFIRAYRDKHGNEAAEYAEMTIPAWASGRVRMSGLVCQRMFDLIPQFMQAEERIDIVEKLWSRFRPRHEAWLRWGPGVDLQLLMNRVREYIDLHTEEHDIPAGIRERFSWLSRDDAEIQQTLLKHYTELERNRGKRALTAVQEIIDRRITEAANYTGKPDSATDSAFDRSPASGSSLAATTRPLVTVQQTVEVAGLKLHINFDSRLPPTMYLAASPPPPAGSPRSGRGVNGASETDDFGWIGAAAAIIGLLIIGVLAG